MEEKIVNAFLESFSGKEDAHLEDDIIRGLTETYISDRMLTEKWEESGLEEEYFEKWIKMYLAPFEDISYDRLVFSLNFLNDVRIFDEYILYFDDIEILREEPDKAMLDLRYTMLKNMCRDNKYFQRKYVNTLLKQARENIKKAEIGSSSDEK